MTAKSFELRPASDADSAFAFEVEKAALGEYVRATFGWDEEAMRALHERRFQPSWTRIIVAKCKEIGLVKVDDTGDRVRLLQLFILPGAQGQGIGSQVLQLVLADARRWNRSVGLRVLKSNPRARAFYERHGFAVVRDTETHHYMETAQV